MCWEVDVCGVGTALVVRFADRNKLTFVFKNNKVQYLKKHKTFFIYSKHIIRNRLPSSVTVVDK